MRWLQAGVVVLSTVVMTGCPSEFGKDGRVNKAVRKDVQESLVITRCSEEWKTAVCDGPLKDEKKCQECGG